MKHTDCSVPPGSPPDLAPHCSSALFRPPCVQRDCSTPFHYTPYEGKYPEVPTTPDALHLHKVGCVARAGGSACTYSAPCTTCLRGTVISCMVCWQSAAHLATLTAAAVICIVGWSLRTHASRVCCTAHHTRAGAGGSS